jgi:Aspartyl protease
MKNCFKALQIRVLPLFLLGVILGSHLLGQTKLPIIKANSTTVDIRDGHNFRKGHWTISPEVKPDVYYVQRSKGEKKVIFYTDVDSISFQVTPGKVYDFIILLKGTDSCYTQLSSEKLSYVKDCNGCSSTKDTIPFHVGKGGSIHILGRINHSELLDFKFDTGADNVLLFKSSQTKNTQLYYGSSIETIGFGGASTRPISHHNRLEIANLNWSNESVIYNDHSIDAADGLLGWNLFEDKIVEIDYDQLLLIIHDSLFHVPKTYTSLPMVFKGTPHVPLTIFKGKNQFTDLFSI